MNQKLKSRIVRGVKTTLGIHDLSLFMRKKRQYVEIFLFHRKYTAKELVTKLVELGMKPGSVVFVHCAMNNFYNYRGTVDELIDELLSALGPYGTLCMPAYPYDKNNPSITFDVRNDRTAAGLLAETFRKRPGVKRSKNKLHSVCALGFKAEEIVSEHHLSDTCFDEHSPFFKIAQLGGLSISLGLPKYFIGTVAHVPDSLLMRELKFYKSKFVKPVTFNYLDENGQEMRHTMFTCSAVPYVRSHSTRLIDENFDKTKYSRTRFSNLWINVFDVHYLVEKLVELGRQGKTIYKYPKFSQFL